MSPSTYTQRPARRSNLLVSCNTCFPSALSKPARNSTVPVSSETPPSTVLRISNFTQVTPEIGEMSTGLVLGRGDARPGVGGVAYHPKGLGKECNE